MGLRSSLGAEQKTTYTPLGETETLHARQAEESDAWESRIRYDEGGREIERFATGGVRITSEYDFAGRLEARCTLCGDGNARTPLLCMEKERQAAQG